MVEIGMVDTVGMHDAGQIDVLRAEHAALKTALADIESRRFLTPAEQLERRRLQKRKLLAKDRIVHLEACDT